MITPPLLIAIAAVFWGIESGYLIVGLVLAVVIGGAAHIPAKWNMSDEDCVRVSDLTSIVFLAAAALIFLNVETVVFLKTLVIWQPLILLPLIFAQHLSGRKKIVIGTKFSLKRKGSYKHNPLDFRIYYLSICLLSAAMANSRSLLFYPCAAIILFWLLLVNRGKAFSRMTFALVFIMAAGTGYFTMRGAESVHDYVSDKTRGLLRDYFYAKYADPFQTHLTYGSLGRLKKSGSIILRLATKSSAPNLLRLASYENYSKYIWHSRQPFQYLLVENLRWDLLPKPHHPDKQATIEFYLPKEKGLLPHPKGSYLVEGPTIYELEQKADGITRVIDGAPLITYTIFYNSSLRRETDQPSKRNYAIHPDEEGLLEKVVENWQLDTLSAQEKVAQIRRFFATGFTYSLTLDGKGAYSSALENFLLGTRKGYCELFATATTLLLRKVGVASRYVTGYAVAEKSALDDKFIIRERHAHAWSEAFVDGRWITVDTTPADWLALDRRTRSSFEKMTDVLALLKLKYDHFRIQAKQNYRLALSLVLLALAAILIYRIYRRLDTKAVTAENFQHAKTFNAIDSPMYLIEQRLLESGVERFSREPFLFWAERINAATNIDLQTIEKLFKLHMKLRFDPAGLEDNEKQHFMEQADTWLAGDYFNRKADPL